jgi:LPXTG-site transpeptidase (sortase) family protein
MYVKQRFGYLFVLLILTGSIVLGGWVWNKFSLPLQDQQGNQNVATPTVHIGGVGRIGAGPIRRKGCPYSPCSTPTSQPGLDMNTGVRLLIPAIGVDAPVEPVGVLSSGELNVPQENQWTGVGWYENGPIPGQTGSAVIDGHLDRPGGAPAVFWDLNKLHIGDMVMVVGAQEKTLRFHVMQLQKYHPDRAPLDKVFGDTSGTYLNLITCAGLWIPAQHQTTERLVVYTKMV